MLGPHTKRFPTGTNANETRLALSDKGPFVTFGASLVMDAVSSSRSYMLCCGWGLGACVLKFSIEPECRNAPTKWWSSHKIVREQIGKPSEALLELRLDILMASLNIIRFLLIKDRAANVSSLYIARS
jgi:hypothetical protein